MNFEFWVPYVTALSIAGSGIFGVVKWADQRKRELDEKRFEQYWKLIQSSQESEYLAEQKVALMLLKRFPEYRNETVTFLKDAKERAGYWFEQNSQQVNHILEYF